MAKKSARIRAKSIVDRSTSYTCSGQLPMLTSPRIRDVEPSACRSMRGSRTRPPSMTNPVCMCAHMGSYFMIAITPSRNFAVPRYLSLFAMLISRLRASTLQGMP